MINIIIIMKNVFYTFEIIIVNEYSYQIRTYLK